jgi:putative transposase
MWQLMPSRNVLKLDLAESYYHVYARGNSRQEIFLKEDDYLHFLNVFRRYLCDEEVKNSAGIPYEKLGDSLEVLCYCLMPNHFHLLLYQQEEGAMQRLMRGVMTGYSRYFNTKYKRSGSLFESRYKAALISDQKYLEHITRYIHLNPKSWRNYPYSSIGLYLGGQGADWVKPERILSLFDSSKQYEAFVSDYEKAQRELEVIKHQLACDEY